MVRIGDKVYHFMNMRDIGSVIDIRLEGSNIHLEGGTSQQQVFVIVSMGDGRIVKMRREDVMKAE